MTSCRILGVILTFAQAVCAQLNSSDVNLETAYTFPKNSQLNNSNVNFSNFDLSDDEVELRNSEGWQYEKVIKGYEVASTELKIKTKILQKKKVVKIEIETGSARTVEMKNIRRDVEIKVGTWNKINKVRIRVPFGIQPSELKILERPSKILIFAPYGFIEFKDTTSTSTIKTIGKVF